MRVTGIIAEYNPLHNGHVYQLSMVKDAGADAIVVALSGNFVQRGEPAVFDKWTRTKLALDAGADLVIEIPTLWCLADASKYAKGGVSVLESLGLCEQIAFGSESGDVSELMAVANNLCENREYFASKIKDYASEGLSYPKAREKAYIEKFGKTSSVLASSNDILGLEYIMASNTLSPLVIQRVGANYNDAINNNEYQSASGIREALRQGKDVSSYIPNGLDYSEALLGWDNLFDMARILILNTDSSVIDECPSGGEGLGNRLKEAIRTSSNFNELIEATKSKRYTYTRISRLLMQLLLGIDRLEYQYVDVPYLRVLGFNDKGRELMAFASKNELNSKPFITNVNKNANELSKEDRAVLELDLKASDVYNLILGRNIKDYSDNLRRPVIK